MVVNKRESDIEKNYPASGQPSLELALFRSPFQTSIHCGKVYSLFRVSHALCTSQLRKCLQILSGSTAKLQRCIRAAHIT
jgi:hypothetical protein